MIYRIWPHTPLSRRTRPAQEHLQRPVRGGASPNAGRAAARAVKLPAGPAYPVVVCDRLDRDGHCRRSVWLALQCVTYRAGLWEGHPGPTARHPRPACPRVARGAAQSCPPHRCGTARAGIAPRWPLHCRQTGPHGLGRDPAALAPRNRLEMETGQAGGERPRPAPGGTLGSDPLGL
jgi:hypothetical protein